MLWDYQYTDLASGDIWQVEGTIRTLPLVEGSYNVGLTVNTPEFWDNVFDLAAFTVTALTTSVRVCTLSCDISRRSGA